MTLSYTPHERLAAQIIASLITPNWPSGPDLDTPVPGVWAEAVKAVREPYHIAEQLMQVNGKQYDSPADAATAWEGLRMASDTDKPWSKIEPLIGDLLGDTKPAKPKKPKPAAPEYVSSGSTLEQPESVIIIERLRTLGYEFRLNSCSDTVEVNGRPITDMLAAEIRMRLRDIGLAKKIAAAEDAYIAEAKKNAYHPVKDYLDTLTWDGKPHIAQLTKFMTSNDPPIVYQDGSRRALHHIYIHRWLVGAVAKVYTGAQNAMLVLDGGQGIGKSTWAHWICPLSEYFIEGAINVQDKDSDVRLISQWVWEVSELDATTRKADQSALKSFITKEVVSVRKAYGRHDTKKPAMCSLIGTVNNTSGFLADESGSRRFMITKLERINYAYHQLDVDQIWAEAKTLYFDGEPWQLQSDEAKAQAAINRTYEAETVLTDWLQRYFIFDREATTDPLSLADVIRAMDIDGYRLSGSERQQAMELSRVLIHLGAKREHTREGNRWFGLYAKPK